MKSDTEMLRKAYASMLSVHHRIETSLATTSHPGTLLPFIHAFLTIASYAKTEYLNLSNMPWTNLYESALQKKEDPKTIYERISPHLKDIHAFTMGDYLQTENISPVYSIRRRVEMMHQRRHFCYEPIFEDIARVLTMAPREVNIFVTSDILTDDMPTYSFPPSVQIPLEKYYLYGESGILLSDLLHLYLHEKGLTNYTLYRHMTYGQGKLEARRVEDAMPRKEALRNIEGKLSTLLITKNAMDILFDADGTDYTLGYRGVDYTQKAESVLEKLAYLRDGGIYYQVGDKALWSPHVCKEIGRFIKDVTALSTSTYQNIPMLTVKAIKGASHRHGFYLYQDLMTKKGEEISHALPKKEKAITQFRTEHLTREEVLTFQRLYKNIERLMEEESESKENDATRPLLPFTPGQLGLVLTSGALDGTILGSDGTAHIIKGRVVKHTDTVTLEDDEDTLSTSEIVQNKVEINLFLPDGTFKSMV